MLAQILDFSLCKPLQFKCYCLLPYQTPAFSFLHATGLATLFIYKKKVPPETGESYIFKKDKIKNEYFCGNMKSKTNAPLYIYT